MYIPYWGLVLIALALLYLINRSLGLYSKIRNLEFEVYVNTEGVVSNPPNFMELMEGKTINFKLGKEIIHIPQISFIKGINTIDKIITLVNMLSEQMKIKSIDKIQEMKNNVYKMKTYNAIVYQIYDLSKNFVNNKGRFKKELFNKAKNDYVFILSICEEVIDFWSYVGKIMALLAKGKTKRMIHGEGASLRFLNTDINGKIEIKPRYDLSMN
jgi:hypothetical protein